jgi:hypothetical protein
MVDAAVRGASTQDEWNGSQAGPRSVSLTWLVSPPGLDGLSSPTGVYGRGRLNGRFLEGEDRTDPRERLASTAAWVWCHRQCSAGRRRLLVSRECAPDP